MGEVLYMGTSPIYMVIDKALAINGWMSVSELELLAELAVKSKQIVEFGSYYGRSTRVLADNTNGIVHAVDPWIKDYYNDAGQYVPCLNADSFDQFKTNLRDHIESNKVVMYRMFSKEYPGKDADFVFLDGDHRYETVKQDILIAQKLVKKGIIAGHDYIHHDWPGVKKAVDEFFPKIRLVDSIWMLEF